MSRPLCKDCKFFDHISACNAPQNQESPSLVDGLRERRWLTCSQMRKHGWLEARVVMESCGKSGRWFQPKEPVR